MPKYIRKSFNMTARRNHAVYVVGTHEVTGWTPHKAFFNREPAEAFAAKMRGEQEQLIAQTGNIEHRNTVATMRISLDVDGKAY